MVATSGVIPTGQQDSWPPTIGRPISTTRLSLLDRWMQPIPPGVIGEIYIAGAGVGRGYLGQPAMTAERFLPDPWSTEPGKRLYKTGDLGRYRRDGRLDFVGRNDTQVNIRGMRIELREIESALRQQPDVQEAVVIVQEIPPTQPSLVAYIVPAPAASLTCSKVRQTVARILPGPPIPTAFVLLAQLPLLPNGKLDRHAFPAPTASDPAAAGQDGAASTALEELLVKMWAELLGRATIGVSENFFASGGHSLLAARVMARVDRQCGVHLPLRTLFEQPTIKELAQTIASEQKRTAETDRMAGLLSLVRSLSDDEVHALLASRKKKQDV